MHNKKISDLENVCQRHGVHPSQWQYSISTSIKVTLEHFSPALTIKYEIAHDLSIIILRFDIGLFKKSTWPQERSVAKYLSIFVAFRLIFAFLNRLKLFLIFTCKL